MTKRHSIEENILADDFVCKLLVCAECKKTFLRDREREKKKCWGEFEREQRLHPEK